MKALGSQRAALQVIANVPLAALGAIVALLIVNRPVLAELAENPWYTWPLVWIQTTHLSLAHWVGFITLIGIVSRNGIMMISHYQHLMHAEGMPFGKEMIIRGSLERLAPVMMVRMDVRVNGSSALSPEVPPTLKDERRLELRRVAAAALEESAPPFSAMNLRNLNRISF
jgi:hypothetical protein